LVRNVRAASAASGQTCRIEMDLGGPKLRTGDVEQDIVLCKDDRLHVTRERRRGTIARTGPGAEPVPAVVPCTLPQALDNVKIGDRLWFDDGKIGGVAEALAPDGIVVRITHARESGSKLRADKGINLPDTKLEIPALTSIDREHLSFVARNADIVGLSVPGALRAARPRVARRPRSRGPPAPPGRGAPRRGARATPCGASSICEARS